MKNTVLLPRLQVVLFSAALGREATLSLAAGASSGAHARFGGHAASRWRSPPITFSHHSASHDASRTSGAPVVAPHVPALVSSAAGLSFAHCPRLLLLHVQTHLASKHDGLQGQKHGHYGRNEYWIFSPKSISQPTSFTGTQEFFNLSHVSTAASHWSDKFCVPNSETISSLRLRSDRLYPLLVD